MPALEQARLGVSPRLCVPPTPWQSIALHGLVVAIWAALLARAFVPDGLFAWSAGLVYIAYDTALIAFVFWQTLGLRHAAPAVLEPTTGLHAPTMAVIVAAHNEAAVLPGTLAALFAQRDAPDLIVIADDGSSDDTADLLAARYGLAIPALGTMSSPGEAYPSLRWLRLARGGKARALNVALMAIDTDLVMTVDGDTLLDPAAVGAMRHAFAADPKLVAATGVLTPVCSRTVSGRFYQWFQTYEYIRNFLSRYAWARLDSLLLISGAFAGFRRDAAVEVGGFDPACMVEDYELIHRLRRHGVLQNLGWSTGVVGAALARTDAPSTTAAFLRQRRRWFCGFLQTQYWYRDMVGNPRYGLLGLAMLPVKAIDTLQPLYGLTALALFAFYLVTGRVSLFAPVAGIIAAKIAVDFAFHLWSIHLYRRWVDPKTGARLDRAILASVAEPFTFQVLRHLGAAIGWVYFLTGRNQWGKQSRLGLLAAQKADVG